MLHIFINYGWRFAYFLVFQIINYEFKKVIELVSPYSLVLSCTDLVNVLQVFTFSSDKLIALKALANLLIRDDLAANNQTIVDSFTFSSDKQKAIEILTKSKSRTCVYGPINEAVSDRQFFLEPHKTENVFLGCSIFGRYLK